MHIYEHLPKILETIAKGPTTLIVAPTGSGKSLGVPLGIAESGSRCMVSVPTRTAALSLTDYQRTLQKKLHPDDDVTKRVGYAADNSVKYNNKTLIVYVTSGHLRIKFLSYFKDGVASNIDFCDVLMVDEIHSGTLDNTIIISLWMAAVKAKVKVPKLVVASATPVPMSIRPAPNVYTVEIPSFNIEYKYLSKDPNFDDSRSSLYEETAKMANMLHNKIPTSEGHILIFAAGSSEVDKIVNYITPLTNTNTTKKAIIIKAYGALKQEDLQKIYAKTGTNQRKIVVATNIAEMAITIEDIVVVIDTMLEKRVDTSLSGGFRLSTHLISKDSAKQRAGRTGRTRDGFCYRMCTKTTYDSLEEHRPLEVDRVPLYESVIQLLDVGLDPETVLIGVNKKRLNSAIYMLNKLGMIIKEDGKIVVTESGHFAPRFPLSVKNAAFLWKWVNHGKLNRSSKIVTYVDENYGLDFSEFEVVTNTNSPYYFGDIENIYKEFEISPKSVIIFNANNGDDMINMLRMFPKAYITAVESDVDKAYVVRRNVERLSNILRSKKDYNVNVVSMPEDEYLSDERYADLITFDPEWKTTGDTAYELAPIIKYIFENGMATCVTIKVPGDTDIEGFIQNLDIDVPYADRDVMNVNGSVNFKLLVFVNDLDNEKGYVDGMNTNEEYEVPLVDDKRYPVFPGIVAAALIDCYGPSYFWTPRREDDQTANEYNLMVAEHKAEYFDKFMGYNDLETCINMWNDLYPELSESGSNVREWSKDNSMNNKKIQELIKIINSCISIAKQLKYKVELGPFTTEGVMNAARPFLLSVYDDSVFIHNHGKEYIDPKTDYKYNLSNKDSVSGLVQNPPKAVIALNTAELTQARSTTRLISFAVDTDVDSRGNPISAEKITKKSKTDNKAKTTTKAQRSDLLQKLSGMGISKSKTTKVQNTKTQPKSAGSKPTSKSAKEAQDIKDVMDMLNGIVRPELICSDIPSPNKKPTKKNKEVKNEKSPTNKKTTTKKKEVDTEKASKSPKKATKKEAIVEPEVEDSDDINPEFIIETIENEGKTFNIIRDDELEYGTKQRGYDYFLKLKEAGYAGVITYGYSGSMDLIICALSCQGVDLECHIYIPSEDADDEFVSYLEGIGASVNLISSDTILQDLADFAEERDDCKTIDINLNDEGFIEFAAYALQQRSENITPTNIWVAADSITLYSILRQAYPESNILLFRLKDFETPDDATVYDYDNESTDINAVMTEYITENGDDGDYLWLTKY